MDRPCINCQKYFDIREHNGKCPNCNFDNFEMQKETEILGYLNRDFGYNGFKPISKGTVVYRENERCYFEMEDFSGKIHRQYFKIETLKQSISYA